MENKYSQLLDEMELRCELLGEGESREECCSKPGKDCSAPTGSHLLEGQGREVPPYAEIGVAVFVIAAFVALVHAGLKSKWPQRIWGNFAEIPKSIVAGWASWIGLVVSYVLLREPYGLRMYEDDYENLLLWFTLPPLCAIAVSLWIRRFVRKKL